MSDLEYFKRGIKLFKEDNLDDALKMLDKALAGGNNDKRMLDTRAAILEKMGALVEALKSCKKVIDVAPSSWQGYARAARIFLKLKKPESSLKMADLALERMPTDPSGQTRRAEMEQTRSDARKLALKLNKRSYFDFLPVEILYSVFDLLASLSASEAIRQGAVCRRWHDVLCGMPTLWNTLALKTGTPQKKIDLWMRRSGGRLKSLSIGDEFTFDGRPQAKRHFVRNVWEGLEELRIEGHEDVESLQGVLPDGACNYLQLKKLTIAQSLQKKSQSRAFWGLMERACSQSLQSLVYHGGIIKAAFPWQYVEPCSTLRELVVDSSDIASATLFPILRRNASLETLDLVGGSNTSTVPVTEEAEYIELPQLKACRLGNLDADIHLYLKWIRAPNLSVLSIGGLNHNSQFLTALSDLSLPHLEEFRIIRARINNSAHVLRFLKNSPLLRQLSFNGCFPMDVNEFVDGLSNSSDIVCPLLEILDLSANQFLRGNTLMRLAKSRTTHVDGENEACSLVHLDVSDCESLDPSSLPWLRSRIKVVISRSTRAKRKPTAGSYTLI